MRKHPWEFSKFFHKWLAAQFSAVLPLVEAHVTDPWKWLYAFLFALGIAWGIDTYSYTKNNPKEG